MEPFSDAVCQAAKWLKSSAEKLLGKSPRPLERASSPFRGLSRFSKEFRKVDSPNFRFTEFLEVRLQDAR